MTGNDIDYQRKTITDHLIIWYVRFIMGWNNVSIFTGILSFTMMIITVVTVKNIYVPLWIIPIAAAALIVILSGVGYFFEKYTIAGRQTIHVNRTMNPDIYEMLTILRELKERR